MKVELEFEDRLTLQAMLSHCKGDYGMLCLAESLGKELLSKEDAKRFNVRQEGPGIAWRTADDDGEPFDMSLELELGPEGRNLIVGTLMRLDEAKMLMPVHKHLYELFILTPVPNEQ